MSGEFVSRDTDVTPIRAGEEFDVGRVSDYLRAHVDGLEGPAQALQFPGGHANLTYLVRFGERELVLRRPPLGPVAPRSHDMRREYRVLRALAPVFARAPRPYVLCEDESVMGAVFFAMERRRGTVVRSGVPPELDRHAGARRRMSLALIDAMAELHDVDYAAIGLSDLGRPEGYALRQVEGWKQRWEGAATEPSPLFDEVYAFLKTRVPAAPRASLVHNDLKLDNCMLNPDDPGRITTILDWDMTTLGDPLVDLGTLLGYWAQSDDPPERGATAAVTAGPGFPKRAELAARYAERRGIDPPAIGWYEAFALWKTAVVIQQIYVRYVRGQTQDARFAGMGTRVPILIQIAARTAGIR